MWRSPRALTGVLVFGVIVSSREAPAIQSTRPLVPGNVLVGAGDIADCESDGDGRWRRCSTRSRAPCSRSVTTPTATGPQQRSPLATTHRGAGTRPARTPLPATTTTRRRALRATTTTLVPTRARGGGGTTATI